MYETVAALGDEGIELREGVTFWRMELDARYDGGSVREGLAQGVDSVDGLSYAEDGETVQIVSSRRMGRFVPDRYSARLQANVGDDRFYDTVVFDELPGVGEIEREAFEAVEERVNMYIDGI